MKTTPNTPSYRLRSSYCHRLFRQSLIITLRMHERR